MAYNHEQENSIGAQAGSAYKKASEAGKNLVDRVGDQAERASEEFSTKGREAAENAQAVVENFRTAVERSTRDHPMTTLVMAAAMGFLLGAFWK